MDLTTGRIAVGIGGAMSALPARLRDRLLPIVLSQVAGLVCGVFSVQLASSLIAPADYGRYGIYLTFTPLGMWVIHAGVIKYVARYWAGSTARAALLRCAHRETWRRGAWIVGLGIAGAIATSPTHAVGLAGLLAATMLALSVAAIGHTLLLADRLHWREFRIGGVASATRAVFPALAYWSSGGAFLALPAGFLLHVLIDAAWVSRVGRRLAGAGRGEAGAPVTLPREFTGWNFMVQAIAGWTALGLTRWLVIAFRGDEAAGYFTLAGNLAIILPSVLGTVLTQYFQPDLFAAPTATADDRRRLATRVDGITALHTLGSVAALGLLHLLLPWLVGRIIGLKYAAATPYVFPAGCFFAAVTMTQFHVQLLLAGGRADRIAWLESVKAVVLGITGLGAIALGERVFLLWLTGSPLLSWTLSRGLARHWFFAAGLTRRPSA